MKKQNFLLGKGERLTKDVVVNRGGGPKQDVYSFSEAKKRLAPQLADAVSDFAKLPPEACPGDRVVASVTLNPEYIAKSYYPLGLFRAVGLEAVGSKQRKITPEKRSKDRVPETAVTTEFFVMGTRSAFESWSKQLPEWSEKKSGAKEIKVIEEIHAPSASEKLKTAGNSHEKIVFEVVLHADQQFGETFVLPSFRNYLANFGVASDLSKKFYAGGLCFLEVEAPSDLAQEIAAFTPVRVVREMPTLRMLRPTFRSNDTHVNIALPSEEAVAPTLKVAVFDGGFDPSHPLSAWVKLHDTDGIGQPHQALITHGTAVSSALLFGHINPGLALQRPYANIDLYRVLDNAPGQNPHELFEVLGRIDKVLRENDYEFANLSLGPRLPIDDDEVHAWTAVLDDRFANNNILATIAVGNDGESDSATGLNRIQVPADCVNALAIGACDTPETDWHRATYSSVGPGRSPGIIKPDLVDFGGTLQRPFLVVGSHLVPTIEATQGTSFSAPSVLRKAIGVRAYFGKELSPLAIRALLVHCSEQGSDPIEQIGWGRAAKSLDDIVLCDDDAIRVVYQGVISPSKYIRADIPLPNEALAGTLNITATLCYVSKVDPHHPSNYTRSGLDITFRPHSLKRKKAEQAHADTKSFFGKSKNGLTEEELRSDAWKWENCLHSSVNIRGTSLFNPCFDIHYNARLEGQNHLSSEELHYALVLSIKAEKNKDFYDQVVRKYATQLEALRPTTHIPLQLR